MGEIKETNTECVFHIQAADPVPGQVCRRETGIKRDALTQMPEPVLAELMIQCLYLTFNGFAQQLVRSFFVTKTQVSLAFSSLSLFSL